MSAEWTFRSVGKFCTYLAKEACYPSIRPSVAEHQSARMSEIKYGRLGLYDKV